MEVIVDGEALKKALTRASKVTQKKIIAKMAQAVFIEANKEDHCIKIWCTDADSTSYTQYLPGTINEAGVVSISLDYIKMVNFKGGDVTIRSKKYKDAGNLASVIVINSQKEVEIEDCVVDYSEKERYEDMMGWDYGENVIVVGKIKGDVLKDILLRTKNYVSTKNDGREALEALYFNFSKKKVVATDGHVIAEIDIPMFNNLDRNILVNINWAVIQQLGREEEVEIHIDKPSAGTDEKRSKWMFMTSYVDGVIVKQIIIKGMQYVYPSYESVYPKKPDDDNIVTLSDLSQFVRILKAQGLLRPIIGVDTDSSITMIDERMQKVVTRLKKDVAPFHHADHKMYFKLDVFERGISAINSDAAVFANDSLIGFYADDCRCVVMQYRYRDQEG